MQEKKQWIVIASEEHSLDDVATALEKKGFAVEAKLDAIGQIIGSATEAEKKEAMNVKGVFQIQPSFDVNIGPPGAEIS